MSRENRVSSFCWRVKGTSGVKNGKGNNLVAMKSRRKPRQRLRGNHEATCTVERCTSRRGRRPKKGEGTFAYDNFFFFQIHASTLQNRENREVWPRSIDKTRYRLPDCYAAVANEEKDAKRKERKRKEEWETREFYIEKVAAPSSREIKGGIYEQLKNILSCLVTRWISWSV